MQHFYKAEKDMPPGGARRENIENDIPGEGKSENDVPPGGTRGQNSENDIPGEGKYENDIPGERTEYIFPGEGKHCI
jgi:hypothetical protein